MNESLTMEPTPEEIAKIDAEISSLFAAMEEIDARIAKDQEEIDRSQARMVIKLAKLKETVDGLAARP